MMKSVCLWLYLAYIGQKMISVVRFSEQQSNKYSAARQWTNSLHYSMPIYNCVLQHKLLKLLFTVQVVYATDSGNGTTLPTSSSLWDGHR